jgi:anaerobic magnesium-protoporphyrin IX monomethyl ester cyclase
MAIDVLLTHSYHLHFDPKQVRKMQPYPPLATLYCAAALREQGFSVAVFDTMLRDPAEFGDELRALKPRIVLVYEDDFNFLSKMCLARMREVCFEMLDQARHFGAHTIAHGCDATDHTDTYLARGFEYVIIGEGETTAIELITALCSGRDDQSIPGTAFLTPSGTQRPARRALRIDLDALPVPARDLIDMEPYRRAWLSTHSRFSMNMISSRGCPFRCNWCAKPIFGDAFHSRSAASVAAELASLRDLYGATHAWFADDIFGINRHWVRDFSAEMHRRGPVAFKVQARADLITPETADALAVAGCEEVWMGVESGAQHVLNDMDKGLKVEEVRRARRALGDAGIRACYFLQLGYPGESWEDICATAELVRTSHPDDIGVSVSYPLPNTKFHHKVEEQLGEKRNWNDSDDLCVMFKGTYSDAFYKRVRDALHAEVASDQVFEKAKLWQDVATMEPASRRADATFEVAHAPDPRHDSSGLTQIVTAGDANA